MSSIPCDLYVDISASDCELPSSKLKEAVAVLLPGQTLMAVSKKQALVSDVAEFCRLRELQLVDQGEMDDMFFFLIQLQD